MSFAVTMPGARSASRSRLPGRALAGLAAALGAFTLVAPSHAAMPNSRDPFFWPFAPDSIWNTPIGSNAKYAAINLPQMGQNRTDWEYLVKTTSTDPAYSCISYGYTLGLSMLSNDPIVNNTDDESTNGVVAIVQPDGSVYQVQAASRAAGGNISGVAIGWPGFNNWAQTTDTQEGYYGAHTGSGLSVLGGSVRAWELQSPDELVIHHAIKLELDQNLLWLNPSNANQSYVWPARQNDASTGGYGVYYDNPALAMGSLLAIPPSVSESSLNLQTLAGKQLFHALQDYGAYVVDTSGVNYKYGSNNYIASFCEDRDARNVFNMDCNETTGGAFYSDLNTLYQHLDAITNNTSSSIGGGGTPRRNPPPAFGTNVAQGKTASASSIWSSSYSAAQAVDGNNSTGWSPSGSDKSPWLEVDLGKGYVIGAVNFVTRQDIDQSNTRQNYVIWASNNADMSKGHVVLGSWGATPLAYQTTWSVDVTDPTAYRYVAFLKTDGGYAFVSELQVISNS